MPINLATHQTDQIYKDTPPHTHTHHICTILSLILYIWFLWRNIPFPKLGQWLWRYIHHLLRLLAINHQHRIPWCSLPTQHVHNWRPCQELPLICSTTTPFGDHAQNNPTTTPRSQWFAIWGFFYNWMKVFWSSLYAFGLSNAQLTGNQEYYI